jgi:hypothetical protein
MWGIRDEISPQSRPWLLFRGSNRGHNGYGMGKKSPMLQYKLKFERLFDRKLLDIEINMRG